MICFNFRTDRSRQLTEVLTQTAGSVAMQALQLRYLTMTVYDDRLQGVQALFSRSCPRDTLGEVLSKHGKKQLRIAETEKYPHVTYFFSGGKESPFKGEERVLCASPKVATYDLAPAMSADKITEKVLPLLAQEKFDFVCLNFANADMVGHTGMFDATVQACEVVDRCVAQVVEQAKKHGYQVLIVSDHGNADHMRDEQGNPYTAHSAAPVPCILVGKDGPQPVCDGKLADVAPTILQCMGLPIPSAMTGRTLINVLAKEYSSAK